MYDRILKHLLKYGSITSMEAIQRYSCTRLSHYIWLMRNNGYIITSERIKHVNKYGEKSSYCKYILIDEVA